MSWKPTRTWLNFAIDSLGLLVMLCLLWTGVIMRFVLPPGSGGRGLVLWGMSRHDWGNLHFWLAVSLIALLLLHVALHWSWVCSLLGRRRVGDCSASRRPPVLSGLAVLSGLVLVVGGLLSWSAGRVEERMGPGRGAATISKQGPSSPAPAKCEAEASPRLGSDTHHGSAETIRGSMTLREVADATGVPVDQLKRALGLPASTPGDERLGRLRRRFGFAMEQVRRVVASADRR